MQSAVRAICHSCQMQHTYTGRGHHFLEQLDQWRAKHPRGQCDVDFIGEPAAFADIRNVAPYAHNADVKISRAASAAFTFTSLNNLASSATYIAGAQSLALGTVADNFFDYLLTGTVVTGTPGADTSVRLYGYTGLNDTPTYPDAIDGTDSQITIGDSLFLGTMLRLIEEFPCSTAATSYSMASKSVASYFGGGMPKNWGLFASHNTGVALAATGHAFNHVGLFFTVV